MQNIFLYDEIGLGSLTAQWFTSELAKAKGPVTVHLNSPGGAIFEGMAIMASGRDRDKQRLLAGTLRRLQHVVQVAVRLRVQLVKDHGRGIKPVACSRFGRDRTQEAARLRADNALDGIMHQ